MGEELRWTYIRWMSKWKLIQCIIHRYLLFTLLILRITLRALGIITQFLPDLSSLFTAGGAQRGKKYGGRGASL